MAKEKLPKGEEKEMGFWDHLEELRWHIIRSIISVFVLAVIAFLNRRIVFDEIILGPSNADFITNRLLCRVGEILSIEGICMDTLVLQIININMSGQFMMHLYISMVTGAVLAFPFILNEIWRFIRPALRSGESKYSRQAVFVSSLLFFVGVLFSYFVLVPLTINFLGTYQVSDSVLNQISINSYVNTVVSVTFAVGIVFELPLIIYFLSKMGLVTPAFLKRNRKYMLVILLIVSAIITPPDVFSQILVCIPLMGLYELSILASSRIYRKQQKLENSH
jgi:sec-independent protein translocase protein TatC